MLVFVVNCCCFLGYLPMDYELLTDSHYCETCERYYRSHGQETKLCHVCDSKVTSALLSTDIFNYFNSYYCEDCEKFEPDPKIVVKRIDHETTENIEYCTVCGEEVSNAFIMLTIFKVSLIGSLVFGIFFKLMPAGRTQLHRAARKGNLQKVKQLISKGEPIDTRTYYQRTPLYFAATNGNMEIVKYLISKGAKVNISEPKTKKSEDDDSVQTIDHDDQPLWGAVEKGHTEIVKYLISKGAYVNIKQSKVEKSGNNDWASVIADVTAALEQQPSPEVARHLAKAAEFQEKNQLSQAVEQYQLAIGLQPDNAKNHHALGLLFSELGQAEQALGPYRRAIELQPDCADAHFNCGNAHYALGQARQPRRVRRQRK